MSASFTRQSSRMRRANSPSLVVTSTVRSGSPTSRRSSSSPQYGTLHPIQPARSALIHSRRSSSSVLVSSPPSCPARGSATTSLSRTPSQSRRMSASGRPSLMARRSSGISQPVMMTGRSRRNAGRTSSPDTGSSGHTFAAVRRLVSKYSAMPSHRTPSKSRARMSAVVKPAGPRATLAPRRQTEEDGYLDVGMERRHFLRDGLARLVHRLQRLRRVLEERDHDEDPASGLAHADPLDALQVEALGKGAR